MSENQSVKTFLFADGVDRFRIDSKNSSKWNEWKFPENCGTIKHLVCGADIVAFYNDLNEIYYFSKMSIPHFKINTLWNKIDLSFYNKNVIKIKNLFANFTNLIIQLQNDELIILTDAKQIITEKFTKIGINFVTCGPLSDHFIVVDKNEQINYKSYSKERILKLIDNNDDKNDCKNTDKKIKLIACSSTSHLLITTDNKLYGCGSNSSQELGDFNSKKDEFTFMETPFEKEIVVDAKGGYYHFVVLLGNGTVYGVGYNNLGQTCVYKNGTVAHFTKITHPLFENEFFTKIYCTSRGTVLITKNSDIAYFIGETVYALKGYEKGSDEKNFESYKINSNTIQKVNLKNLGYNEVVGGGWHYIIYNNYNESKCLQYFKKNICKFHSTIFFKDISIDISKV
ncbi:hypothetical protein ABK040_011752 [Willaertia magna]